jgi:hypothetical protein
MIGTVAATERASARAKAAGGPLWRRPFVTDALAVAWYLVMAVAVMERFWVNPGRRASGINGADQYLMEWMLTHAARSVTHLSNPLFSDRVATPDGMNTMANASILGLGVPLTPVTLVFGPAVTYTVLITLAFAGTAAAWYVVLSRYVVRSRLAAFVGGGFCAFAPGMMSQANGHPHILAQFLVPVIVWQVFRLGESTRPVRAGLVLGVLIAYQMFVGEESLFFAALACAVAIAAWAAFRPREARTRLRPFATGLGVAVGFAVVLLAFPLYWQFFGPQHYRGVPWMTTFNADLGAYPRFSRMSLAGEAGQRTTPFAQNPTELNAFFGWPLLLVVAGIAVWFRRDLAVRVAAIVAVGFALLSFGREFDYANRPTGVPGPWRLVADLPLFNSVVPTRLALVTAMAIGVLLALAVDRSFASGRRQALVWTVLVAVALLPLTPRPLAAAPTPPVPQFFTSGTWRLYVESDGAVMAVPPTKDIQLAGMRWSASQRGDFKVTDGYFLAPDPASPERYGTLARPVTPMHKLIIDAYFTDTPSTVTDADRTYARDELARRGVDAIVMVADQPRGEAVRITVDALVGPGQRVGDVWVWDLRR